MKSIIASILILSLIIVLLPDVSASYGTFRQNSCVDIKTILNTTAVNISTVSYPNSTIAVSQQRMNKTGQTFNYTFCSTSILGSYLYDYYDLEGNVYVNDFEITPSGQSGSSNIAFFLLITFLAYGITIFGFAKKEEWVVILGSGLLIGLGLYMIRNGIIDYRDWYTNYLAYATWGVGVITGLMASLSLIDANM